MTVHKIHRLEPNDIDMKATFTCPACGEATTKLFEFYDFSENKNELVLDLECDHCNAFLEHKIRNVY